MKYSEKQYKNYGKCLEITNGIIDITVTLDVGPRIINYSLCGGKNIFFEDIDRQISSDVPAVKEIYGDDAVWYIYGGHRLWLSPEQGSTYYPDNIPIKYEVKENTITFYQGLQSPINVQGEISLTVGEGSPEVTVLHKITNKSDETKTFAPWALSVLAPGGTEVIPFNDNKTGWLSNRTLMLWDYTEMNDSRVNFGKKYLVIKQDSTKANPFKIGMDNKKGWVAYINNGAAFVKRFGFAEGRDYPDNGCNFETYTNNHMLECETLGTLSIVKPGESVSHKEEWNIIRNVSENGFDDSFGEKIAQIIK